MFNIYLAGRIEGIPQHYATEWRHHAVTYFEGYPTVRVIDPTQYKEENPKITGVEIFHRCINDLKKTNLLLVNLKWGVTYGTPFEVGFMYKKCPIITVYDNNIDLLRHPFVESVGIHFNKLHNALHYIKGEYLSLEASRKRYQKKQEDNMFRAEIPDKEDKEYQEMLESISEKLGAKLPPMYDDIEKGGDTHWKEAIKKYEASKPTITKQYEVRDVKGEATVEYASGGMSSKLEVDYSLMPNIEFIEDVIKVLTVGCTEHGGKYPRDNWKKLPLMDNMTHALQHCLKLHGKLLVGDADTEALMVELTHAVCRLWFIHYQLLNKSELTRNPRTVDKNYTLGE